MRADAPARFPGSAAAREGDVRDAARVGIAPARRRRLRLAAGVRRIRREGSVTRAFVLAARALALSLACDVPHEVGSLDERQRASALPRGFLDARRRGAVAARVHDDGAAPRILQDGRDARRRVAPGEGDDRRAREGDGEKRDDQLHALVDCDPDSARGGAPRVRRDRTARAKFRSRSDSREPQAAVRPPPDRLRRRRVP